MQWFIHFKIGKKKNNIFSSHNRFISKMYANLVYIYVGIQRIFGKRYKNLLHV